MPPAGTIAATQIDLIMQWIEGGATEEVILGGGDSGGDGASAGGLTWTADAQPILQASCAGCHGSSGGWDASTYDSTINSGNSGPAVIPGDADASSLIQRLVGNGAQMPPGTPLSADLIEILTNWVDAGAAE